MTDFRERAAPKKPILNKVKIGNFLIIFLTTPASRLMSIKPNAFMFFVLATRRRRDIKIPPCQKSLIY